MTRVLEQGAVRSEARERLLALRAAQQRKATSASCIAGDAHRTTASATPAQSSLWFLDRLHGANGLYNCTIAVRLVGDLDISRLSQSLVALASRHASLRTAFESGDDGLRQRVVALESIRAALEPSVLDFRHPRADGTGAGDVDARLDRTLSAFAEAPFDLAAAPLMRTRLIVLGPAEHLLQLVVHHAVTDGWSMAILARDLGSIYSAGPETQPWPDAAQGDPALPALPVQFVDYADWLASPQRQAAAIASDIGYWQRKLADMRRCQLPTDRPRPHHALYRGQVHRFELDGN